MCGYSDFWSTKNFQLFRILLGWLNPMRVYKYPSYFRNRKRGEGEKGSDFRD